MDFRSLRVDGAALTTVATDALVLIVATDEARWKLPAPLQRLLSAAVADGDLALKAGKALQWHRPAGVKAARVVAAVCADAGVRAFRNACAQAFGLLRQGGARSVVVADAATGGLLDSHAEAVALAAHEAAYLYRRTKPSATDVPKLAIVQLACDKAGEAAAKAGLARGAAIAAGIELARECAIRPANHCTPSDLADEARALGRAHKSVKVEVLDRKAVEKLGMGSFLAVAQGSDEPLRFIVLRYEGAGRKQAPVVLVGKGITFDTGGISIKPAPEMDEMKFDMGGAASVLGTFRAVAELRPPVNLVGLIPACENMPGGSAVKPGDVVTSLSGQTIEILNTDAEGRLILCDALTYAERFKPAAVIDIATLTGACVIALGHHRSGLFCADDAMAAALLAAGERAHDLAWRMPLDAEYEEALRSNFADMGNVGGRAGGAITAAMFLRKFTGKFRWAHLDIAGTAWKSGAAKGATGRPVGLLTHFILAGVPPAA